MGTELLIAILGPLAGGAVSILVWSGKKNYETMTDGFNNLNTTVNVIERKLDDLRVDVAKNYVTNEVLTGHIKSEEEWHIKFADDLVNIKQDIAELKNIRNGSI